MRSPLGGGIQSLGFDPADLARGDSTRCLPSKKPGLHLLVPASAVFPHCDPALGWEEIRRRASLRIHGLRSFAAIGRFAHGVKEIRAGDAREPTGNDGSDPRNLSCLVR